MTDSHGSRSPIALTLLLGLCSCLLMLRVVAADTETDRAQAWQQLKAGSAIAIMRHALAPGTGDPLAFELEDCNTQRNLSEAGRNQASAIGDLFRDAGIEQATVISSQWCRCMDTAALLGFGAPQPYPVLNSFFRDRSTAAAQSSALQTAVEQWVKDRDQSRILVTHQVNISGLTREFTRSGEILILTIEQGEIDILTRIDTTDLIGG